MKCSADHNMAVAVFLAFFFFSAYAFVLGFLFGWLVVLQILRKQHLHRRLLK